MSEIRIMTKKNIEKNKLKCHPELVSGSYQKTSITPDW